MLTFSTKYCQFLSLEPEKRGKMLFCSSQISSNVNIFTAKVVSFAKGGVGNFLSLNRLKCSEEVFC